MRARKSAGRTAGSRSLSKVSFGCRFDTTARAASFSPLSVTTPTARPFSIRISFTAQFVRISTLTLSAGARDCLRDRAHAADRMTPDALFAVHLAPAMMQQHVARAGGIGTVVSPDDPVEAKDRLDRIALEPLVEHVAGRSGEKFEKVAPSFEIERMQTVSDFGGIDEGAKTRRESVSRSPDWAASQARARAERRSDARASPHRRRAGRRRGARTWPPRTSCAPARPSDSARRAGAGNSTAGARRSGARGDEARGRG